MAPDRMKALRLLVCDIDGTLVRPDKSLSDAVVAAGQRLQAMGVKLSLISARPPSGMQWIADRLGLDTPFGAFNGGTIVAPDGSILKAERLPDDTAQTALELISRPRVTRWLFSSGRWYMDGLHPEHRDAERKAANQEPELRPGFAGLLDTVDKIVAVSDDHALLDALEPEVVDRLGARATVVRSQPYYLDITAPAANKGDGVAAIARATGVSLDQVAVIGDQHNDMAMFRRAGLSIAMGQGPEDVRAAADLVTASNADDGVARAIDNILLPLVANA